MVMHSGWMMVLVRIGKRNAGKEKASGKCYYSLNPSIAFLCASIVKYLGMMFYGLIFYKQYRIWPVLKLLNLSGKICSNLNIDFGIKWR